MAHSLRERKQAALGLTYAVRRLEFTLAVASGAFRHTGRSDGYWLGAYKQRLIEIEHLLRNAGTLLDLSDISQLDTTALAFLQRAEEDDEGLVPLWTPMSSWSTLQGYIARTIARFDKAIVRYQLDKPLRAASKKAQEGESSATAAPASPAPTWIWDTTRKDYYRWDPTVDCYLYASGLMLDTDFQVVMPAQSVGPKNQAQAVPENIPIRNDKPVTKAEAKIYDVD
ncbi:hypothetical protein BCR34DRAFT_590997 [Clohesyomyces aquaticus]|uniref:Uncharacterized protein n=1 Tax=Clohesyomyces aquaticus TaxID=1231657 RepID=A0A1Y1Z4Z2_9PLEO|nr:hypothetical protein BCR34DRAFT_590997 [Clohesyomyces aquaticus]